jgi:hypothetical protein
VEKYRVYLHLDLLDLLPRSSSERRKILEFMRILEGDPFKPGDFTDKDTSLRVREVKIIGDYAVTYWADHPVKTVMIVDIRKAD